MSYFIVILILITAAFFALGSLEGLNNRDRYERINFMLKHHDADVVMNRSSDICPKCGGHKRFSQIVCDGCYHD